MYLKIILGVILLQIPIHLCAQNLEVDGKIKVSQVEENNNSDSLLILQPDGTIGMRDLSSLTEYQILTLSDDTIFLTNGGFVKLPPNFDNDSTNEVQNLSLNQDTLELSKGNSVVGLLTTESFLNILSASEMGIEILLDAGYSIADVFSAGASAEHLLLFGTPFELLDAGVMMDSIIGKYYQGGLIFYLDDQDTIADLSGLIAASADQSVAPTGAQWGCYNQIVGAGIIRAEVGAGELNTQEIILEGCGDPPVAANLCFNLTEGGYSDWFLPSLDELRLAYEKLHLRGSGSFLGMYWSSTQTSGATANTLNFSNGMTFNWDKNMGFFVRAVRKMD